MEELEGLAGDVLCQLAGELQEELRQGRHRREPGNNPRAAAGLGPLRTGLRAQPSYKGGQRPAGPAHG